MENITQIEFPNTAQDESHFSYYTVGRCCDQIESFTKNGEMASVGWFRIIKDNKVIAEIKESVCNIYGEDVRTILTDD